MKTYKQWADSKQDFSTFISAGDEIDDEIYDYFLGVVPPAKWGKHGYLSGEPYSHNGNGEATYFMFVISESNKYFYRGLATEEQFTMYETIHA